MADRLVLLALAELWQGLCLLARDNDAANPAVLERLRRAHEVFGPLRVLADQPAVHPNGADTIVYELDVPDRAVLESMVRTGARPSPDA